MNYTENYQLPQWAESDRVLMEDFNHTMINLEGALNDKAKILLLKEVVLVERQSSIEIDMQNIDWSICHLAFFDAYITSFGEAILQINHTTGLATHKAMGDTGNPSDGLCRFLLDEPCFWGQFFVGKNPQRPLLMLGVGSSLTLGSAKTVSYQQWETLTILPKEPSYYIESGSVVRFWSVV